MGEYIWIFALVLSCAIAFLIGINIKEWKQFHWSENDDLVRWCKFCGLKQRFWGTCKRGHWREDSYIDRKNYDANCGCHKYAKK